MYTTGKIIRLYNMYIIIYVHCFHNSPECGLTEADSIDRKKRDRYYRKSSKRNPKIQSIVSYNNTKPKNRREEESSRPISETFSDKNQKYLKVTIEQESWHYPPKHSPC